MKPGKAKPKAALHFGTDGWRGVIGRDFTFENIRRVASALARYFVEFEDIRAGVVVGYDTRFLSPEAGGTVAEVLSAAGIHVYLAAQPAPTPAVSFAVRHLGTAGAVMITASHNPYRWNGIKLKARYGSSASPRILAEVERFLAQESILPLPPQPRLIESVDLKPGYLARLRELANFDAIARSGFRFIIEPMYGAGAGYLRQLFEAHSIPHREIHAWRDPLFGGLHPEPIPPHLRELCLEVTRTGFDAGLATDGDADRVGAVDASGNFVDPHKIFSLVLKHLLERGERGDVARTFSATKMVDRIAERYGVRVHETRIGFKYICELMLEQNVMIGGEESGGVGLRSHMPERDGILISLLLAEIMAKEQKPLAELVAQLEAEFGPHHFGRVDLELDPAQKQRAVACFAQNVLSKIGEWTVIGREDLDGVKFHLLNAGWVLVRTSGTEPILRLYAETSAPELTRRVLASVETLARAC